MNLKEALDTLSGYIDPVDDDVRDALDYVTMEIDRLKAADRNDRAWARTLAAMHRVTKLCPVCGNYVLVDGYICFGCGYDPTDLEG